MRCLILWLCGTVCAVAQTPDTKSQAPKRIAASDVMPHLEFLTKQKGRRGEAGARAADYIRRHFEKLKLRPLFENNSYFQTIPGRDEPLGRNVGAFLEGSDPKLRHEIIIMSAHYDHLGVRNGVVFPGADDNASGVSMLLEVAGRMAAHPPRRSVAFISFDLEEQLLWGSRWFANHPPWPLKRVKFFMTADMIGRSLGGLPIPTVFVLGAERAALVQKIVGSARVPDGLEASRLGADLIGTRSDYGPFRDRKIPFLFFSTGEHPDYHTPRDTLARLDVPKVGRVSTYVHGVVRAIADADEAPVWIDKPEPDLGEARTLNRITTLLIENNGDQLSTWQRSTVTFVQKRTGQIIERGKMTREERQWLIRMSQVLLFSVL